MISQTDIQGRLRLLRYGLIVLVIVTFIVALLAPYAAVVPVANQANQAAPGSVTPPQITDFLGTALLYAVVVAVLAVIVYFVYQNILQRTIKPSS